MDLPKELLQKYLPKKAPQGESVRVSLAHADSASRTPSTQATKALPLLPLLPQSAHAPSMDATDDPDDEKALFMQAMQGMLRQRAKPQSGNHGAFPLPLPASMVENTVKMLPEPANTCCAPPKAPSASAADSEDAFALAMRTVTPLKGKGRDIPPSVAVVDAVAAQSQALYDLLDKDMVFDVHISGEQVQGQLVGLDPKVLTSLVSGSQSPEARLDLHGMNAAQAFQALVPFFKGAWHKGLRTVIVVTGRGMNSPTGMAVLRQKVSSWLTQEPFKRIVMAFSTAQPCDGGTGSMYILLRKFRKKHPVYWERNPIDSDLF